MFKVAKEQCNECLFGPNKIVSDTRKRQLLADIRRRDSHFICHKASLRDEDVCCAGFYATQTSNLIRIAGRLKAIEFVDVEAQEK